MQLTLSHSQKMFSALMLGVSFLVMQSPVMANPAEITEDNWLVLPVNGNETVYLVKDSFKPEKDHRYTMVGKKVYSTTQSHNGYCL